MIYLQLFWEYFKIGLFTIGGGYAMLPLVTQVVLRYNWLTEQQLANFVAVAESTPGPFAINLATFIGTIVGNSVGGVFGGVFGALVATVGVVLPSVIIIILVTKLFQKFKQSKVVQGLLYGMRPVVVGLLLCALVSILLKEVLPNVDTKNLNGSSFSNFSWIPLLFVVLLGFLSKVKIKSKKIHPIYLILLSAVAGLLVFGVPNA